MSGDGASENYGDPSLAGALPPNSRSWDDTDDVRLREALERGDGKKTWSQIARDAFPNGDFGKVECQARWALLSKPRTVKGAWTSEEDAKLRALVAQHGSEKWVSPCSSRILVFGCEAHEIAPVQVAISEEMRTRTGKQCRERWHNHLDPSSPSSSLTRDAATMLTQPPNMQSKRASGLRKKTPSSGTCTRG